MHHSMRASKATPYDESAHIPFLIRWPGDIPARRVSNEMVHAVDLLPTFASIIGADLPTEPAPVEPPHRLGADNDRVLAELGYDPAAIANLRDKGVI